MIMVESVMRCNRIPRRVIEKFSALALEVEGSVRDPGKSAVSFREQAADQAEAYGISCSRRRGDRPGTAGAVVDARRLAHRDDAAATVRADDLGLWRFSGALRRAKRDAVALQESLSISAQAADT
jgi:hypothetical protein